jgi:hypothetical protein
MDVVNHTNIPVEEVVAALTDDDRRVFAAMSDWATSTQPGYKARNGGLFQRDRYITPSNIKDQMKLAYAAVEQDDIVSGVAESTEALAFSDCSFVADDEDDQDIYNQIAADIDLDSRLREMWQQLFAVSQFYVAVWWETKTYTVRGETEKGNARRKTMTLKVPVSLTLLDPLKIVPIGSTLFGKERLAYCASREEHVKFKNIMSEQRTDQDAIVERLITKQYIPSPDERKELVAAGFDVTNLWELNPDNVFRHTATRPSFQRWAPVRMASVFPLVDLKQHLRQMERAHLIGGTNFIVVITKGSDKMPAKPAEIANLQSQARVVAQIPLLVGDHRLKVEIVTPKTDFTLGAERWNTLDSRVTARLYQMFQLGNYSAGAAGDDSAKLIKVVAKGLESRRKMIRRTLEREIWRPMYHMNDELKTRGKLLFHPSAIALDFDDAWASFLLQLRQDREISRDTILSQFDLSQEHEYLMLQREQAKYDDVFRSQVAYTAPQVDPNTGQPIPPGQPQPALPPGKFPEGDPRNHNDNGGGRRNGGGRAPGSGQGKPARNPTKKSDGKTKPAKKAAAYVVVEDEDGNTIVEGVPVAGVDLAALVNEGEPDA